MSKFFQSKIPKFAFIGTSCSGKTTATYEVCSFLKKRGIRADGILQQDRRLPFTPDLLDKLPEAQHWFISNMMTAESYMAVQKGTDCIVSDRSVLDFFAYYSVCFGLDLDFERFVLYWAKSYNTLFYLKPRTYDNDGVRPTDEFRLKVDKEIVRLCNKFKNLGVNIIEVDFAEEAATFIAIKTKQLLLGVNSFITGSYSKGVSCIESDFDFVVDIKDYQKVMKANPKLALQEDEYVLTIKNLYSDFYLEKIAYSKEDNIEIQFTSNLKARYYYETQDKLEIIDKPNLHQTNSDLALFYGVEREGVFQGKKTLFVKNLVDIEIFRECLLDCKNRNLEIEALYFGAGAGSDIDVDYCESYVEEFFKLHSTFPFVTLELTNASKILEAEYFSKTCLDNNGKILVVLTESLLGEATDLENSGRNLEFSPSVKICVKQDDGKVVSTQLLSTKKTVFKISKFTLNRKKLYFSNNLVKNTFDSYPDDTILYYEPVEGKNEAYRISVPNNG